MPIFEYVCDDCGSHFEKLVRRSEQDGVECPSCGERHLTQKLSTFAAHANGTSSSKGEMPACPGGMCATPNLCGRN